MAHPGRATPYLGSAVKGTAARDTVAGVARERGGRGGLPAAPPHLPAAAARGTLRRGIILRSRTNGDRKLGNSIRFKRQFDAPTRI